MAKSSIADILEVQRLISKLDKRGKLAILRDLQKQGVEVEQRTTTVTATGGIASGTGAKVPVTYTEGME